MRKLRFRQSCLFPRVFNLLNKQGKKIDVFTITDWKDQTTCNNTEFITSVITRYKRNNCFSMARKLENSEF